MSFRQDDGDKDKFNESLHHFTPKKFNHSLHYLTPIYIPEQKYYYDKKLECDSIGFNGSTSNIRIPDSTSLSPTSTMTAMVWVKGEAQNGKWILSHYDGGVNQKCFGLTSEYESLHNKVRILISDDGTTNVGHYKDYKSSIVAFDSTWYLVGFSFDAGTLKLYIDGIEDTNPTKVTDNVITTIHNSTADITLGCFLNNNVPTGLFTGNLAKPLIYNRILTDDEWMNVYAGIPISRTGLVLDMPMINNCTGNTIKDLSGYNNHGTLTDCVWNQKWVTERRKVI